MTMPSLSGVSFASSVLAEEQWVPTPLLPAASIGARLGVDLWLKREDCTPVGSFKIRGALTSVTALGSEFPPAGIYVASAGNYGMAIAAAAHRVDVRVTVVVPEGATPSKVDKIRLFGGDVVVHGSDFDEAKEFARDSANAAGAAFWEDGVIEEMAIGAGTIAAELLEHPDSWDAVVVPLGNGSLMKGIAHVFKARSPSTRTVAVIADGAPAMAQALLGEPWDEDYHVETLADGLAVRVPIGPIVEQLKSVVDDVWLVGESAMLPAVKSLVELEQVLAEPSAAISVAGVAAHSEELQGRRVAAIVTGAHLRPDDLRSAISGDALV